MRECERLKLIYSFSQVASQTSYLPYFQDFSGDCVYSHLSTYHNYNPQLIKTWSQVSFRLINPSTSSPCNNLLFIFIFREWKIISFCFVSGCFGFSFYHSQRFIAHHSRFIKSLINKTKKLFGNEGNKNDKKRKGKRARERKYKIIHEYIKF